MSFLCDGEFVLLLDLLHPHVTARVSLLLMVRVVLPRTVHSPLVPAILTAYTFRFLTTYRPKQHRPIHFK
jgi:hypothetical protein